MKKHCGNAASFFFRWRPVTSSDWCPCREPVGKFKFKQKKSTACFCSVNACLCPQVISTEKLQNHIFRLTGPGADRDPKGLFTIDIDTGDVSVSRPLDREAIDTYQVGYKSLSVSLCVCARECVRVSFWLFCAFYLLPGLLGSRSVWCRDRFTVCRHFGSRELFRFFYFLTKISLSFRAVRSVCHESQDLGHIKRTKGVVRSFWLGASLKFFTWQRIFEVARKKKKTFVALKNK